MIVAAEVLTVLLAALAAALALAHALELPGKIRLPRETYLAVQRIYYPGFTIGVLARSRRSLPPSRWRSSQKARASSSG